MAKVIETEVDSRVITENFPLLKVVIVGLTSGFLFWLFTFLLEKYLLSSMACTTSGLFLCSESLELAGDIASILVVVISIILMINLRMTQPLIIAVATAASLWGLASWTFGLTIWEVIAWSLVTYLISYLLFSWVVRYDRLWPVLISILIIVMIVRILVNA